MAHFTAQSIAATARALHVAQHGGQRHIRLGGRAQRNRRLIGRTAAGRQPNGGHTAEDGLPVRGDLLVGRLRWRRGAAGGAGHLHVAGVDAGGSADVESIVVIVALTNNFDYLD